MLVVLSPAKSLDLDSALPDDRSTTPRLLDEAASLVEVLAPMTPPELGELMGVSDQLAELNTERFSDWTTPFDATNARPALFTFAGDVYQGLQAETFDTRDLTRAQKVLRILSGLYGVLRPLDLIQPYRLEMGTRLRTDRGDDLYGFWGDRVTDLVAEDLRASPGTEVLVDLASREYAGAIRPDRLGARIVAPAFFDAKGDAEPRIVSFSAKRARGAMAGWIVRQRVSTISGLDAFDGLGYRHDPERSTPDRPVFVRRS